MAEVRPIQEFEPLMKAAQPTVYQTNAFRLLGVAVDAPVNEINRQIQKVEMMLKLGVSDQSPSGLLPLQAKPSPSILQDVKQRLADPQARLIEEFFWFWPEEPGTSKNDLSFQALQRHDFQSATDIWLNRSRKPTDTASIHNLAVLHHLRALETALPGNGKGSVAEAICVQAWKYWKALIDHDPYWQRLCRRIADIDDPRLKSSVTEQMRSSLLLANLQIDLALAIHAAETGDFSRASVHGKVIRESGLPAKTLVEKAEQGLEHVRTGVAHLCENAEKDSSANVDQTPQILRKLLDVSRPKLQTLNYLLGAGNGLRDSVHDQVAGTVRGCLIDYGNKTKDWETCDELLSVVQSMVASSSLRPKIAEDRSTLSKNAAEKKLWGTLEPITDAPSLTSINGIGFMLYGESDRDAQTTTYATTYYFTFFFIPIIPICRYRVTSDGTRYRFWGKLPLRTFDKWHLAIVAGLIVLSIISIGISSATHLSPPGAQSPPAMNIGRTPPTQAPPAGSRSTNIPSTRGTTKANTSKRQVDVPAPGSFKAESLMVEINANNAQIATLSAAVEQCNQTVAYYKNQISEDRQRLDQMKSDARLGLEVDETEYERVRTRHNSNIDSYNSEIESCRATAEQHDALVDAINTKIREFNRLIGAQ